MVLIGLYKRQEGRWHITISLKTSLVDWRINYTLKAVLSSFTQRQRTSDSVSWVAEAVARVLCSGAWGDCGTTPGTGGQWGPGLTCSSLWQWSQSDRSGESPSLASLEHTWSLSALVAQGACPKGCSGHHSWTQPGFPAPNTTCGWEVHTKGDVVSRFSDGQPLSCT